MVGPRCPKRFVPPAAFNQCRPSRRKRFGLCLNCAHCKRSASLVLFGNAQRFRLGTRVFHETALLVGPGRSASVGVKDFSEPTTITGPQRGSASALKSSPRPGHGRRASPSASARKVAFYLSAPSGRSAAAGTVKSKESASPGPATFFQFSQNEALPDRRPIGQPGISKIEALRPGPVHSPRPVVVFLRECFVLGGRWERSASGLKPPAGEALPVGKMVLTKRFDPGTGLNRSASF